MEEYQVITRGRLVEGYAAIDVKQNLQQQFGLEISVAEKLLSGATVAIKKRLDWSKARTWQQKLTQLGLRTELAVQFNPACLRAGLRDRTKTDQPPAETGTVLIPDADRISPTLVSFAHTQGFKTEQGKVAARLDIFSAYWSPLVILLTCAFFGLILQRYLLHVLSTHLQHNALATVAGIVFLLLTIVCLPRLLQPRQFSSLTSLPNRQRITVLEKFRPLVGHSTQLIHDESGGHLATLNHGSKHAELQCPHGRQLFQWRQHIQLTDSGQNVADQIRDQLLENTIIGTASTYLGYLGNLTGFVRRRRQRKAARAGKHQWQLDSARPVLDADGELAALVYQQSKPAIELQASDRTTTEQLLLLAFCCQLIRNPLV